MIGQNENGLFRVAFQSYVKRAAVSEMKKLKIRENRLGYSKNNFSSYSF